MLRRTTSLRAAAALALLCLSQSSLYTQTALPISTQQVIVITGCTSGIGRGLAVEYASMGHTIACCGRRENLLQELRDTLEGGPHLVMRADVTIEADVMAFASELRLRFGHADVVIANAGINPGFLPPWLESVELLKSVLDVNLIGVHHTIRAFVPLLLEDLPDLSMMPSPRRLITISSGLGHSTNPYAWAYSSSKWAVESLSKSTAQAFDEFGYKGRLLCVPLAPGIISTGINTAPVAFDLYVWSQAAARFILSISSAQTGASLSIPGFYSEEYKATWAIPDGLPLPSKVVPPSAGLCRETPEGPTRLCREV